MRMAAGGLRAAAFEAVEAPAKGDYLDKVIYLVEGLPGAWRRCKMPKGDPAAAGLLAAFFDGQIIYLEHVAAVSEEIAQYVAYTRAPDDARAKERADAVAKITEARVEYLIRERNKTAAAGTPNAQPPEAAQPAGEPSAAPAAEPEGQL